jgi:hypothetical protein
VPPFFHTGAFLVLSIHRVAVPVVSNELKSNRLHLEHVAFTGDDFIQHGVDEESDK